jgi:syntaxin 16
MESDADKSFSQSTLQQTSQKLMGTNDAAIMQREREINDIAKGIIELSDIFRELQTMIIDQGTMLDRIDYNVERMATEVKAADKELKVVCTRLKAISYVQYVLNICYRRPTTSDGQQSEKSCCCYCC